MARCCAGIALATLMGMIALSAVARADVPCQIQGQYAAAGGANTFSIENNGDVKAAGTATIFQIDSQNVTSLAYNPCPTPPEKAFRRFLAKNAADASKCVYFRSNDAGGLDIFNVDIANGVFGGECDPDAFPAGNADLVLNRQGTLPSDCETLDQACAADSPSSPSPTPEATPGATPAPGGVEPGTCESIDTSIRNCGEGETFDPQAKCKSEDQCVDWAVEKQYCCVGGSSAAVTVQCFCYPQGRCCPGPFDQNQCNGKSRLRLRHRRGLTDIPGAACNPADVSIKTCASVYQNVPGGISGRDLLKCVNVPESDVQKKVNADDETTGSASGGTGSATTGAGVKKEGTFPNNLTPLELTLYALGLGLGIALIVFAVSFGCFIKRGGSYGGGNVRSGNLGGAHGIALTSMPSVRGGNSAKLPKPPPNAGAAAGKKAHSNTARRNRLKKLKGKA
eukprot:g1962.t1